LLFVACRAVLKFIIVRTVLASKFKYSLYCAGLDCFMIFASA
jgi:hypothetical protein